MIPQIRYRIFAVGLLLGLVLGMPQDLKAQKVFQPKQIDNSWKGIIYKKEHAFDFRIHTNGMALAYNSGTIKSYYKTKFYHFELGYLKDPREKRQNRSYAQVGIGSSSDFVFGKQTSVWVFRTGIGYKTYLSEKAKRKGVAIGYSWVLGPSIAILRPYYLTLRYKNNGLVTLMEESYSEENASIFLDRNCIYGGTGFFDNFDEISFKPGVQGKLGLHFGMGAFDKYVKAVDVGIMGEVFASKIPLMVETEEVSNKPYFINFYVNLQLGLRRN